MASKKQIDKACEELLTHPHAQAFKTWTDHLQRNVDAELRPVCYAVLSFLCTRQGGESFDVIRAGLQPEFTDATIKSALTLLSTDGFLAKNRGSDCYSFLMSLLAEYWREYQH